MSATKHTIVMRRAPARSLATLLMSLPFHCVLAQHGATVTDADIERVRRLQPTITERDIEQARRRHGVSATADQPGAAQAGTPNIGALPQPLVTHLPDLEAVARGFEINTENPARAHGVPAGPTLLVFISFAMPEATLKRLVEQASRAGAALVLRGLVSGSLRETMLRTRAMIGTRKVALLIDPQAFDRFQVVKTPCFVLVREGPALQPCATGQCPAGNSYASVSGDVSLDYALEHVERAAPRFAQVAAGFLGKLRRNP